jgi:hypothetical protein
MSWIDPKAFCDSVAFQAACLAEMITMSEAKTAAWLERGRVFSSQRLLEESNMTTNDPKIKQNLRYRRDREKARISDFRRLHPAIDVDPVLRELDAEG